MQAVTVQPDGSIKLPKAVRRLFPNKSQLGVWTQGDTIILKRLKPLSPSQIARRAQDRELSLKEIAAEVHRMRREKRTWRE
jgi:hypothetical protein